MLTDNGPNYRSHAYCDTLAGLASRHKRTRPFRLQMGQARAAGGRGRLAELERRI
jgi:hypothetical protein